MISPVLGYNTMAHTMEKHRWIWAIPVTPRRTRRTGLCTLGSELSRLLGSGPLS